MYFTSMELFEIYIRCAAAHYTWILIKLYVLEEPKFRAMYAGENWNLIVCALKIGLVFVFLLSFAAKH